MKIKIRKIDRKLYGEKCGRKLRAIHGPYKRDDKRFHVIFFYGKTGVVRTVSYPKFIIQRILRRRLEDWETVDHIDGDVENNLIENLQVLSRIDNIKKSAKKPEIYEGFCEICGKEFTKFMRNVRSNKKKHRAGPFCGKRCAGIYSTR